MSASDKKKLRKEQNAAAVTEKQQNEKKVQKKQKIYTLTFIIAMVLVVAIVLVAVLQAPVTTLLMKSTTAVTVGEHQIDAAQFNYFYVDAISNFYNQFSSYGDMQNMYLQMFTGLNPAASVGSQVKDQTTGQTWADYFADSAIESAKWTYAMYDKAMAANYTLSEEEKSALTNVESYMSLYATLYGYSSADQYLKYLYGSSASMKDYMAYYEISTIASSYANKYIEGLEYTNDDYRKHEAEKYGEYCSYSYATFNLTVSNYLTGGTTTKDENNKETTTYSDAEKEAARKAALAQAESLAAGSFDTVDNFNIAINAMMKEDEFEATSTSSKATEVTATLFSNLSISNEDMKEWVTSDERKAGDISYFENSTTTNDVKTVSSYTVVLFLERIDNTMNVGTVRHLLVKFEGGTTDKETNKTTYSDEEKAKALAEAEKLLEEFKAGEQTEEAFTAFLKKHSEDTDSSGNVNNEGLYADITPDSGYVESFTKFATAEHKPGDMEIVESEFGYHIMYYVEANELNYRDMLIKNDLMEADYTAWEEATLKAVTVTEGKMTFLNDDYILARAS